MPRLTEATRELQRRRFLDAVRVCVARDGIAATSMDTIRREANVSAGAMYRYFATKDELIRAAVTASLGEVADIVQRAAAVNPATPYDFLARVLGDLDDFCQRPQGPDLYRVAVQGWAFAQTDPGTAEAIRAGFERLRELLHTSARTWDGSIASADALGALIAGHVVTRAIGSDVPASHIPAGIAALTGTVRG